MSTGVEGVITGVPELLASFGEMGGFVRDAVKAELENVCILVHETAVKSIEDHMSSGRVYKRGNVEHVASAPGNPPNADLGTLHQSIDFDVNEDTLVGTVGTNLLYGLYLEFGTTKMVARPWLQPALDAHKKEITESLGSAIQTAIAGRAAA